MKKLAKLSVVFTVICMALALGACSHSGSDYDWKKKNPGSSDPTDSEAEKLLTLTNEWDGTYVFYDDGTFEYKESDSEEVTLKGTYEGDASKDGELKLSVTSGYWDGEWKAPDNDYGIYFVIEGDSATGYDWWMEDGKEVKDEENPTTFTKVEEEEEPGNGSGGTTGTTGDGSYTPSEKDYYGTWKAGWSSNTDGYGYLVIEKDNTFYYLDQTSEINGSLSLSDMTESDRNDGPNKGTWTYDESSNTMKLSKEYWWDFWTLKDWNDDGMTETAYGFDMTTTSTTSATVIETKDGVEDATKSSTYTKISDSSLFYDDGGSSDGTTGDGSYTPSVKDYYGTWKADWSSSYYAYIIIEENTSTYYYYNVGESNSIQSSSQKGTYTYDADSNTMTLSAGYWYSGSGTYSEGYSDDGVWTSASNYGFYIETTSDTSASVTGWSGSSVNNYSDTYTKQ